MIDEVFVENAADTLNSSGKYDVSVDGGLKVFKVLDKKRNSILETAKNILIIEF